jgi:hypothetical protein
MRRALRIAEIGSLSWWLFALATTNLFTFSLPDSARGMDYQGCVRILDMMAYIACGSSWGGRFLGGLLTWAAIWTEAAYILMDVLSIPILVPLALIWIASVLLASACLYRMMLAPVRAYRSRKA